MSLISTGSRSCHHLVFRSLRLQPHDAAPALHAFTDRVEWVVERSRSSATIVRDTPHSTLPTNQRVPNIVGFAWVDLRHLPAGR
jgi:hypothetical protein